MNIQERTKVLQDRLNQYAIQSDGLRTEVDALESQLKTRQGQLRELESGKQQILGALSILREQAEAVEVKAEAEKVAVAGV